MGWKGDGRLTGIHKNKKGKTKDGKVDLLILPTLSPQSRALLGRKEHHGNPNDTFP